jgi:hypothetical protein
LPFRIRHSGALRKNSDYVSNGERVDSERFVITAAGENFDYDNDGAVFTWSRSSCGRLRQAVSPICFIQVITRMIFLMVQCDAESKPSERTLAQEIAALIAIGTHNWQSQSPGVRPRDEVSISNS